MFERLAGAVSRHLGARLVGVGPKLNVAPDLDVRRLDLEGGGPRTAIAKVVTDDPDGSRGVWMEHEGECLRFLAARGFPWSPALLGMDPGLLLLEDLGVGGEASSEPQRTIGELLAAFQRATLGEEVAWETGLSASRRAHVAGLEAEWWEAATRGAEALDGWAPLAGVPPVFRASLDRAKGALDGGPRCLNHGDLASGRQLVFREGVPFMLDLERARFGPAELDLAIFLVGEVAVLYATDGSTRLAMWRVLDLGTAILEPFRRAGGHVDAARLLEACLARALHGVGTAIAWSPDVAFQPSLGENLGALLRHAAPLVPEDVAPALAGMGRWLR